MKLGVLIRTFCFLTGALASISARADLIINVTGTPGSLTTMWEFTGSIEANDDSSFQKQNNGNPQNGSWDGGDFTTLDGLNWTESGLTAVEVVIDDGSGTSTFTPDALFLSNANVADRFALSLGNSKIDLEDGDTIAWSGTANLNIAFDDLNTGVFNTGSTFGGVPVRLNISAVPEPASGILLLSAGMLFWRRRS